MHSKAITGLMLPGLLAAALVGCGGSSSSDNATVGVSSSGGSSGGAATTVDVGATVTGLAGTGLVLQLSSPALTAPEDVSVAANATTATFSSLTAGTTYTLTVATEPSFPTQQCAVSGGTGTATATVAATVTCTTRVGRFLFTSNNGTGASGNSVSAFTIGVGGTLTSAGAPVPAGMAPYAMTLDPTGNYLYVGNESSGDISMYSIDQTTGVLTPLATPTIASGDTAGSEPEALVVDASGTYLYSANESEGDIYGYTIGAGGVLTEVPTGIGPVTLASPDALAADPNGEFIYVANHGNADVGGSVTAYAVNSTTGALTLVADYATGIAITTVGTDGPTGLAIDPTGKYLYLGNFNSSSATQPSETLGYSINVDGTLTALAGSPFAVTSTGQMTVDPSGQYLLTVEATATPSASAVGVFAIGADGSLTAAANSPYDTNSGPFGIAVDPSGQYVYASDSYTNFVEGYGLDSSGTLATFGQTATGTNPDWIVVD